MSDILAAHPNDIKAALLKGLRGPSAHRVLAIFAGLEKQLHEHAGEGGGPVRVVHEHRHDE